MTIEIPAIPASILQKLNRAGYEAYVVGGFVRDAVMGRQSSDCDIATNALPEQIQEVFSGFRVLPTGLRHGTVTVLTERPVEITTYRVDGSYGDGRHPDAVSFTKSITEDLARRDFTMNAIGITENGELYNVDGNSNRVACIVYGPRQVIMVVGVNKIVKNIDEAVMRVKTNCAPKNTKRLDCQTPCNKTGECISLMQDNSEICAGCGSDGRVCCNYVITARQRHKDRIKVIIVNEDLGF